jgi:segregation and condensation protein B
MDGLKNIIESLLFVADTPITLERFKEVLELEDAKEARNALEALAEEYDQRDGGIFLSEVAGGYQIRTRPEYHEYVKRLLKPGAQRLSNAALETLAIIAYKQPIIRSDVEHLRGVDCGGVLRVLMEKKLVRVLGRKEIPGRPLIYATTKHFLEVFELKNLKDLPSPKEIEKHADLPQGKLAAAALLDPPRDSVTSDPASEPDEPAPDITAGTEATPPDTTAGAEETVPDTVFGAEESAANVISETEAAEPDTATDVCSQDENGSNPAPPQPPENTPSSPENNPEAEKKLDLDDQRQI